MDSLLMIVDVQNGFINKNSEHVVKEIGVFADNWLRARRKVMLTKFINPEGSKWETLLGWTQLRSSEETDLVAPLVDLHNRYVNTGLVKIVEKASYSSLVPDALEIIQREGIREIYLCGIDSDSCVLATAIDVFEAPDLVPFIFKDLCASSAGAPFHAAGMLMADRFIGGDQILDSRSLAI